MTLELVPEIREKLKEPHGELYKKTTEIIEKTNPKKTISVGDLTTYNLLKSDFHPKIAIIDGKVERKKTPKSKKILDAPNYSKVKTKNPPGQVTDELMKEIRKAIKNDHKTIINVDGEEDLAVIPSIKYAPKSYQILYGQPKKGIVRVKVNPESKQKIEKIIGKMRRI